MPEGMSYIAYWASPALHKRSKPKVAEKITYEMIVKATCKYYNITGKQLRARGRDPKLIRARKCIIHLTSIYVPIISLKSMGEDLGYTDHSTAIFHRNTALKLMKRDTPFRKDVYEVMWMLPGSKEL